LTAFAIDCFLATKERPG